MLQVYKKYKIVFLYCILCGWTRAHARTHARELVYWELFERTGLHARGPGQLRFNLCIIGTRPRVATRGTRTWRCLVCVGFCHCCYTVFVPWRKYQFYRGRERICAHVTADFSFDSWRSSRICKCVCAGSMHQRIRAMALFRLFKHLANLHERD